MSVCPMPSPHGTPGTCSEPGPGESADTDWGLILCQALCGASLLQTALPQGWPSSSSRPAGRMTPKQTTTKLEQHLGCKPPTGGLTQLWKAW